MGIRLGVSRQLILILSLSLWGFVWLGISPGNIKGLTDPTGILDFIHGLRFLLPFIAGLIGVVLVILRLVARRTTEVHFFSPLGLAAGYGLVGVLAVPFSPSWSIESSRITLIHLN